LPNLLNTIDATHRAARDGQTEVLRGLVKTKRLALARDRYGCTPLHTAIIYEQTEVRVPINIYLHAFVAFL
jgi:hypothetical protein